MWVIECVGGCIIYYYTSILTEVCQRGVCDEMEGGRGGDAYYMSAGSGCGVKVCVCVCVCGWV